MPPNFYSNENATLKRKKMLFKYKLFVNNVGTINLFILLAPLHVIS